MPIAYLDVLRQVTAMVDYLRVTTDRLSLPEAGQVAEPVGPAAPSEPEQRWISCASLIESPDQLLRLIRQTAAGRGTDDDVVAASLFVYSYAFLVASVVVAPYGLGMAMPSCAPANMHITIAGSRPAAVAIDDMAIATRTSDRVVAELFADHLGPHIDSVLSQLTIGRRLLWGNVAASCATVFRALDGAAGADRAAIQQRAADFATSAEPWIANLGSYETVTAGGRSGWFWTRTVCCLWYQCAGGGTCDDCSLTSAADRASARRRQLGRRATPPTGDR